MWETTESAKALVANIRCLGKTLLGEHLWETTESAKAFFVNFLCSGNWVQGLGEPVPGCGGTGSPGRLQPISILDCKNPKGKPGWGEMHFQEFWDSGAQNKTSEISTNALSIILGLLCAEQHVRHLKACTFIISGTPVRSTKRQKY